MVPSLYHCGRVVMTDDHDQPHRPFKIGGKDEQVPAFNVTFAVN